MPILCDELADWWHLFSAPGDYDEEAAFIARTLQAACPTPPRTLLELGSGGGNNAIHLSKHFEMTLVDLSPGMLAASRRLNPGCEHIQADMRTLRMGRLFDAVLVHDAIVYMTTPEDLHAAISTASAHCRLGAPAIFLPDLSRETFVEETEHGGHDREGRGVRYLSWTYDPEPADHTYIMDFAYLLHAADGSVRCLYDRHVCGLFSRGEWLEAMRACGFDGQFIQDEIDADVFLGVKR